MKKMNLPKVGMITFSDPREHEYKVLYEEKTAARMKQAVEYFADYDMELYTFDQAARSPQEIDRQTKDCLLYTSFHEFAFRVRPGLPHGVRPGSHRL